MMISTDMMISIDMISLEDQSASMYCMYLSQDLERSWLLVVDLGKWENHQTPLPCFQTPYFVDRHFFLKHIQDKESVSK